MRAAFVALLWLVPLGAAARTDDARVGAWDRSVAAERAGDLPRAERIMTEGWGGQPENYWVRLRLAYLALLQGQAVEAHSRYEELRRRPESEGDVDLPRGYASAVAAVGWEQAAEGDPLRARATFREALEIDPNNAAATRGLALVPAPARLLPEVWSGVTGQEMGRTRYLGWVVYGDLPVRLTDHLTLRASGRYLNATDRSVSSPWAMGTRSKAGWHLSQGFLSLAYEGRSLGGEAVGVLSDGSDTAAIVGGGARLRVGSRKGLLVEGIVLHRRPQPANVQLRPLAFMWLGPHEGLQAGARLTRDERGSSASANAGASLLFGSLGLFLQGHLGDERWAFDFAGPSLLSFDATASWGGSATLTWQVTRKMRLAVQGEGERLREEGARGAFWSVSGGIQVEMGER